MSEQANILVVDDDPVNLRLLDGILTNHGYTVRFASSGLRTLKAVAARPPDLILLDIKMPGMDGMQVCERLKSDEKTRAIPIIFISALGDTGNKLRGFAVGGVDYITKPFATEEVLARVKSHLALYDLQLQLEQRVVERTAELEEKTSLLTAEVFERQRSEERMAEAQRLAHIGSWELDLNNEQLNCSDEMLHIFEMDASQFKASYNALLESIHPDDRDMMERAYRDLRADHKAYDRVYRLLMSDGRIKSVNARGWTLFKDGQPHSLLGTIQNITERLLMEKMGRQTEKMASIAGLAAGMAHELNNPLGAILQGIQNIQRRLSPDLEMNLKVAQKLGLDLPIVWRYFELRGIENFLKGIQESGKRAAVIVENMLQFARKPEDKFLAEDLGELIDSTIELAVVDYDLKKKYDFRNIEIVREYEPAIDTLYCIKSEIQQVLFNLFRNAAQAFQTMAVLRKVQKITIRIQKKAQMVCIEVEDNGPGMDETIQSRIFEPFFTTRGVGEGTGLGLSVSYFIITQEHSGAMTVESQAGIGTKFLICLPVKD